ncbi:MAG: hypothetical protein R2733_10695 [Acidimicrobiales bacterium]
MSIEERPCKLAEEGCDNTVARNTRSLYRGPVFCADCNRARIAERKRRYGQRRAEATRRRSITIDTQKLEALLASIERQAHVARTDAPPAAQKRLDAINTEVQRARSGRYATLR